MNLRPPGYELMPRVQSVDFRRFPALLFRKSAKSRRSYALRSAGIFPVLGQIVGQSFANLRFGVAMSKRVTRFRSRNFTIGRR